MKRLTVFIIVLISIVYGVVLAAEAQQPILFEETFRDNRNSWSVWNRKQGTLEIKNGKYIFENKGKKDTRWRFWESIPIDQNRDFQVDTTIQISKRGFYEYGLVWGGQGKEYYYFLLREGGTYSYGKREKNQWKDIRFKIPSRAIDTKNLVNTLSIAKTGNRIKFFINGQYADEANFENFFGNSIGFFFRSDPNMRFEVDNLIVRQASPATPQTQMKEARSGAEGKKIALVMGNSTYKESPLHTPVNDAKDMTNTLRKLGFTVITRTNVNQRKMEEAIQEFIRQIQQGHIGLFYFSGHGIQIEGENYLIPVNEYIRSENEIRYKTIQVTSLLEQMEASGNRNNIVILEACRREPFTTFRTRTRGLASMNIPRRTLLAYVTAPNSATWDGTGRNSTYTKHLLHAIQQKGFFIEQTLKNVLIAVEDETHGQQTPSISSSLRENFSLNP